MELRLKNKDSACKHINNIIIFTNTVLILLVVYSKSLKRSANNVVPAAEDLKTISGDSENCDIFQGEWVRDENAPYYTNTTCSWIHQHRNCMKNGRPDSEFLKWRWRPDGCELAVFDPFSFFDLVRNKTMAFVGDSLSMNHMQSLMCLLSRVENPLDLSSPESPYSHLKYEAHNFTLLNYWSPFLIRIDQPDYSRVHNWTFMLHLDEFDDTWTSHIDSFDYIILNVGPWYAHTAIYHENRRVLGCHDCNIPNITDVPLTLALGHALRTALRAINYRRNFRGVTFLRTVSPSHFEGKWNEGGNCPMRQPFTRNETALEGLFLDTYRTQLREFRRAVKRGSLGKKEFRLLDVTRAMLMRPDGHPSRFWHGPDDDDNRTFKDCLHWCLPGPIDSWSEFLFHMLKMEREKLSES